MSIEAMKEVVRRFNREVIEQTNENSFRELVAPHFVNRSSPPGAPNGPESMWNTFRNILKPAFSDLRVTIHQQVAEGDVVTTRKTIHGKHTGQLFGIAPTNREVAIEAIDMVRLEQGRYVEHWGINNLTSVLADLKNNPA